jgi:hypothetical protein
MLHRAAELLGEHQHDQAVRPPLCLLRVTIQVPRQKPLRAKSGARVHDLIPRYLSHKLLHWLAGRTERGWRRGLRRRNNKPGEGGRPPLGGANLERLRKRGYPPVEDLKGGKKR